MKKNILILSLLLCVFALSAQNMQPFQNPQSKKWGYKTTKSIMIEPIYEAVKPFYQDYACVKTAKGWGIIFQMQKKYIIEPQFLDITILPDHNLWVQNQQKMWGIMNFNGTWVQPCQYQSLGFWEWYVNFEKKWALDYDTILFKRSDIHGLMTKTGTVLKTLPYNKVNFFNPPMKVTTVSMLDEKEVPTKFGMIDYLGNELVPCIYEEFGQTNCGMDPNRYILYNANIGAWRGDSCTVFNIKGEMIAPLQKCK